jgi:hypothetical protein
MMEQDEVEAKIKHIKRNMDFFVTLYADLIKQGYPKHKIDKQIDRFLDKLIELIKLRK